MSDTIELLSPEDARKPYWDQYYKLTEARNKTMDVLRALGVTEFPDKKPEESQVVQRAGQQAIPAQRLSQKPQTDGINAHTSLPELVRKAGSEIKANITRNAIVNWIQQHFPERVINPASVGVILGVVAKEDGWKLDQLGIGGKPSIYTYPADQ